MPRKQRFKPSRKQKPMIEVAQDPDEVEQAAAKGAAGLEPGPREAARDGVHLDDVEGKERDG